MLQTAFILPAAFMLRAILKKTTVVIETTVPFPSYLIADAI